MHPHALSRLRSLLSEHIGGSLTPELCQQIELAARTPEGAPVDLSQFERIQHGAYTLAAERFADVLDELHPLHQAHWQETERHRHGLAMAPDYLAMAADEAGGALLQFTARDGQGQLAGHVRMYLRTSRHTGTLFAVEDTLYIKPEHRGGLLVVALMRYAEQALVHLGVREIRADSKLLNRADVLMRRLGYQPVALQFHKFFNGGSDVL